MEITRKTSDSRFPLELKHPNGGNLVLEPTRLLLAFLKPLKREEIQGRLLEFDLVLEDAFEKQAGEPQRKKLAIINHTDRRYWVRSHDGKPVSLDRINTLEAELKEILEWVGPVYRMADTEGREGLFCPLPDVLMVKPVAHLKEADAKAMSSALEELGLHEVKEKSRYLNGFRFCNVVDPRKQPSLAIRTRLEKQPTLFRSVHFDNMPMVRPTAVTPTDPLFVEQWDMTRIQAPEGWNISTGTSTVVVCVLDTGCDLTHPDLTFSNPGLNLHTMLPDGSPTGNHGTACAGIVAAKFNNALGPAGVAGNCQILPLAVQDWTESEIVNGITYAADHGAKVISMSFGWDPWDHALIDPAIQHAFDLDVVMCVATHNYDGPITYPATNPLVMAIGASDEIDNRKTPLSPDGEGWGSDFGPQISVVAPGVHIPTTDRQGAAGYNHAAGVAGDYFLTFNGTSAATPHVAGLAALLRSTYPGLTNVEVRRIIERTADKVGVIPYATGPGHPNGTWNQEMGYGRINVFHALNFADIMIKDSPADTGAEPSFGNYWERCDVVVRPADDNVFIPTDPVESSNVERGHTNYLYVRVNNNGPAEARNVVVNTRIVEYPGVSFVYPDDWTLIDAMHVSPAPVTAAFAAIPAGTSVIAKFTISAAQVDELWGWQSGDFKPCLLAEVTSENDYAFAHADFAGGVMVTRYNNLAQRNLTVIEAPAGATVRFPFVLGNIKSLDDFVELVIERGRLPRESELLLSLEEHPEVFPKARFEEEQESTGFRKPGLVFLDRTRVETNLGPHHGVLVLEKGSRFDGLLTSKLTNIKVKGGEIIERNGARFVRVEGQTAILRATKLPNTSLGLTIETKIPVTATRGERFKIALAQRNTQGEIIGGASVMVVVK